MSQRAISIPFMAPEPTTPVIPWPIMPTYRICQIFSMFIGSSPITIGEMSSIAALMTTGHPLLSPTPVIPSSV